MYKLGPKLFSEDRNPIFFKCVPHTHILFSFTCCWLSASSYFLTLVVFIFFPTPFNMSISTQSITKFTHLHTLAKFTHLHTRYLVSLTPTKVTCLHNSYIDFETKIISAYPHLYHAIKRSKNKS
jgi:hypothetical protein